MSIEDEAKTEEAEAIVRYLGKDENIGQKKTPHSISKAVSKGEIKVYQQKVEKILSLLVSWAGEIFGYEKLEESRLTLFWIKDDKNKFKAWFKEWFGKDFEEKEE